MSLNPGEEMSMEILKDSDQFFQFEYGNDKCFVVDKEYLLKDGDVVIVTVPELIK